MNFRSQKKFLKKRIQEWQIAVNLDFQVAELNCSFTQDRWLFCLKSHQPSISVYFLLPGLPQSYTSPFLLPSNRWSLGVTLFLLRVLLATLSLSISPRQTHTHKHASTVPDPQASPPPCLPAAFVFSSFCFLLHLFCPSFGGFETGNKVFKKGN